jgi:hypothetical protein
MRLRRLVVFSIIVGLALALAAAVMSAQGSFLRENIVRPLSYAFWIASILIRGTPQVLFWAILLVLAFVMAGRSLFGSSSKLPRVQIASGSVFRRSRLRYWLHQLELNRYESARFQLYEAISRLSLDVLSYQEGVTLQQYQRQLDPETIQPEYLAQFFRFRSPSLLQRAGWNVDELRRMAGRMWEALPFHKSDASPPNPDVERVVAYLEQKMDLD